jgi:uncharacterized protein YkwD
MIPLQTLRNDIFLAICVIFLSGCALTWLAQNTPVIPLTTAPAPTAHTQSATAMTPTLIPSTEGVTSSNEATTSAKTKKTTPPTTLTKTVAKSTIIPVSPSMTDTEYLATLTRFINNQPNAFRKSQGRTSFTTDPALTRNATSYSKTMLAGHFLSHTDKTGCDMTCRFTRDGYDAWAWGENLAVLDFDERPTPEYVANYFMTAWEKSAGHRANLLNPAYTVTGIGVAMNGSQIYATVQFAEPK